MDLEALWNFEKNRLTIQFEESSPTQHNRSSDVMIGGFMALMDQTRPRNDKKRLISMAAKREIISSRLLEESSVPKVSLASSGSSSVHKLFDANGFAMEYQDHAPRRMTGTNASWVNRIVNGYNNNNASSSSSSNLLESINNGVNTISGGNAKTLGPLHPLTLDGGGVAASLGSSISNEDKLKKKLTNIFTVPSGANAAASGASPPKKDSSAMLRPMARLSLTSKGTASKPSGPKRLRAKKSYMDTNEKVLQHYDGDMFGTRGEYVDGMLYMSRMKPSSMMEDIRDPKDSSKRDSVTSLDGATARGVNASSGRARLSSIKDMVSDAIRSREADLASRLQDDKAAERSLALLKHQQRCALTLSNWSSNSANAQLMIEENAVQALILLCKPDDLATRISCATAIMNLSKVYQLRSIMVQQGAVRTVSELVADSDNKRLRTACAITLANLCSLVGNEENIVGDGAVAALSVLLNELPSVSIICQCALFNLTCVNDPYHKIESVLKTFVTLASSSASSASYSSSSVVRDDIVGKALCNLSNFKRIRLRLMEEGILSALTALIQSNNVELQKLPAYILMNLSEVRNCRSEMVAKGAMTSLGALAALTKDFDTRRLVATTLLNLSKEEGNRLRMVLEGLLTIVPDLCSSKSKTSAGADETASATANHDEVLRGICARALYNVSCSEDTRVKLVEREVIGVLTWLSKGLSNGDAKKMCTVTLCNLLSVQQAASNIVNAGAIDSLIELSMAPNQSLETKYLFSKALHGLCERESTRDAVTDAGIIPAIIYLSSIPNKEEPQQRPPSSASGSERKKKNGSLLSEIRTRCAAALSYLAANSNSFGKVSNASVVQGVTDMLRAERGHVPIERFCCACLSWLSRDETCSRVMADYGSIDVVLATCRESNDLITKACGCHVVASMSCHPSCAKSLVDAGVMKVLSTLAKIREPGIQRSCASALANLSRERAIRDVLVRAKSVGIVAVLSNSYSEESQRDCSRILCNLSFVEASELTLVQEGSLNVLLMISMVRALNATTKETCMKAFVNLIGPTTVEATVQEGLIKVLPALASLESTDATEIATFLYGRLLCFPTGREALCGERSALQSLFGLMERMSPSTNDRLCCVQENLMGELVRHENSRTRSVQAGIVDTINKVLMQRDVPCSATNSGCKRLAMVLFTLSKFDATRMAVASVTTQTTLASFLAKRRQPSDSGESGLETSRCECSVYALGSFCYLSWHDDTFEKLNRPEVTAALVNTLNVSDQMMTNKICLLTLCCLSWSTSHCETMVRCHVIHNLYEFFQHERNATIPLDGRFLSLVAVLLRQLSHCLLFGEALREKNSQVIPLFCALSKMVREDEDSALDCADILCGMAFSEKVPPQLITAQVFDSVQVLMSTSLAETRWRCAASILSLSCVTTFRSELVMLGYTSLLVQEAQKKESSTTLNILKCCACALSNLSMFVPLSSSSEPDKSSLAEGNRIAAFMVEQGAVPALIHLSKLDNEEIQEQCTLALSNLSSQSPTVDSVAVSALLTLSLRNNAQYSSRSASPQQTPTQAQASTQVSMQTSSQSTASLGAQPQAALQAQASATPLQTSPRQQVQVMLHDSLSCRTSSRRNAFGIVQPPLITSCRHKEFSTFDQEFAKAPEFDMVFGDTKVLCNVRYEASNEASLSAAPVLPPLEADGDANGVGSSNQSLDEERAPALKRNTSFSEASNNAEPSEDATKSSEYVGFAKMEPFSLTTESILGHMERTVEDMTSEDNTLKEENAEETEEDMENPGEDENGGGAASNDAAMAQSSTCNESSSAQAPNGATSSQPTSIQRVNSQMNVKKLKMRLSSKKMTASTASGPALIPAEPSLQEETVETKEDGPERNLFKAGDHSATSKSGLVGNATGLLYGKINANGGRSSPKKSLKKSPQVSNAQAKRNSGSSMATGPFKSMSNSASAPALALAPTTPDPPVVFSNSLEEMPEQVRKLGLWC